MSAARRQQPHMCGCCCLTSCARRLCDRTCVWITAAIWAVVRFVAVHTVVRWVCAQAQAAWSPRVPLLAIGAHAQGSSLETMLATLFIVDPQPWAAGNEFRGRAALMLLLVLLLMPITDVFDAAARDGVDGFYALVRGIAEAINLDVLGLLLARSVRLPGLSVLRVWVMWKCAVHWLLQHIR